MCIRDSNYLFRIIPLCAITFFFQTWLSVDMQWTLRGLCIGKLVINYFIGINMVASIQGKIIWKSFKLPGFIIFLAVVWVLQEFTKVRILRYVILFIGEKSLCFVLVFNNEIILVSHIPENNSFATLQNAGVMNSLFSVYGMILL